MYVSHIKTPLGAMRATSDERALYALEFIEDGALFSHVSKKPAPIVSIEEELRRYFQGELECFQTPLAFQGSPFQKAVWKELKKIPFGETRSYADIARAIENPLAVRAVGSANGANRLAIVIPCHRVINANGALGGYASGLARKQWLLTLEGAL